jgi:hypothetical protein
LKNKRALLTLFTALFAIVMATSPVYAYTYYHGATASWEYGDTGTTSGCYASYDTSTGVLSATAISGQAGAYLNSGNVDAVADVNNIMVTVWYTSHSDYLYGDAYVEFGVTLNVNGNMQGLQSVTDLSANGYVQFYFDNLDINSGDDLDINAVVAALAGSSSSAYIEVDLSYVGFTTE